MAMPRNEVFNSYYVIKLEVDDDYNTDSFPVAVTYGLEGYWKYDDVMKFDNVIDVTDKVSEEVKSAWIGGSMWGWDKKVAEAAVKWMNPI